MFKVGAILVSVVNMAMGAVWFLSPHGTLMLWGLDQTSPGMLVERRLGIVLFMMSLIMLLARDAPPSPARSAISYGLIFGALALAAMSAYDFWSGAASPGILPGIGFNLLFALGFGLIEWKAYRDRKEDDHAHEDAIG